MEVFEIERERNNKDIWEVINKKIPNELQTVQEEAYDEIEDFVDMLANIIIDKAEKEKTP